MSRVEEIELAIQALSPADDIKRRGRLRLTETRTTALPKKTRSR